MLIIHFDHKKKASKKEEREKNETAHKCMVQHFRQMHKRIEEKIRDKTLTKRKSKQNKAKQKTERWKWKQSKANEEKETEKGIEKENKTRRNAKEKCKKKR